ncbi:hypothetical protein [Aliikangiella coralliicola]|uniref:Uncharacterized protein n=1 Tax=Aliikangiella coralliicola TaxID=2592383 RepID=A0A545UC10_9GAMM|nr:hypothetical protein [Aliikangiella coralliicola]TQV87005.1 hypothetical protein FLL46_14455 [Aliikangiella coralliicola]
MKKPRPLPVLLILLIASINTNLIASEYFIQSKETTSQHISELEQEQKTVQEPVMYNCTPHPYCDSNSDSSDKSTHTFLNLIQELLKQSENKKNPDKQ